MSDVFHCNRSSFDGLEHYYRPKVEVKVNPKVDWDDLAGAEDLQEKMQMTALERNFNRQASSGVCDICGESAPVMADIATMKYRCFACCMKERLAYEDAQERRKKRIPLDMEDFCK